MDATPAAAAGASTYPHRARVPRGPPTEETMVPVARPAARSDRCPPKELRPS
uniref:Uncharacterized protein n=1 Tax=Zea mays TaxID=4577 RepID=B6SPH5_MAIZE|nr:hypothetical protein [Zea mays]